MRHAHAARGGGDAFAEILTGSAWALSARVAATALTVATSVVIARLYGADALGIVAVIQSFLMIATILTVLGTGTSILRLIPEHTAKYSAASAFRLYRRTQFLVAGVSVVTGLLVYLGSGVIAERVFSKPHLAHLFALAAAFVVAQSLAKLNTQAVRGLRLIRVFAFMQLLPALAKLLLLLGLTAVAFHGDNPVYALLGSWLVAAVVGVVVMDLVFRRRIGPDDRVKPMGVGTILSISLPMLMTSAMALVIGETGVILLGMFRPEAEVGYYSVAVKMATLTSFMLTAINTMAAPKFSELYHSGNLDELFRVAKKSTRLIFWTSAPILLGLLVLGKPVLRLMYGEEFTGAYPALAFLTLGQFVNSASGSTGAFLNMTGRQRAFRNIVAVAAVMNVGLNLLLIPSLGILGAALAGMATMASWNVAALVFIKRRHGRTVGYFPGLAGVAERRAA